ncbi:hypothetical protein [Streptomyces sp. NPDC004726]
MTRHRKQVDGIRSGTPSAPGVESLGSGCTGSHRPDATAAAQADPRDTEQIPTTEIHVYGGLALKTTD